MAYTPTYQNIIITAAGLTATYGVDDQVSVYNVIASGGTVTLAGNVSLSESGMPKPQTTFVFNFQGGFTVGAYSISFFGVALTASQALYEQTITAVYDGSVWDVSICSDMSTGAKNIQGGDIVDSTIGNAAFAANTLALTKLANANARGHVLRSGASGAIESVLAKDVSQFVCGTGTDVGPVTMSGDTTLNNGVVTIGNDKITTVKIADANVTPAKLTTELRTEIFIVPVSFETGEQGAYKVRMSYSGSFTNVSAEAIKALSGTDNGTIILKNQAGVTMTVTTPIVFAASDPFGTTYSSAVTANNTFVAGDYITVTSSKATAGGKSLITLESLRS